VPQEKHTTGQARWFCKANLNPAISHLKTSSRYATTRDHGYGRKPTPNQVNNVLCFPFISVALDADAPPADTLEGIYIDCHKSKYCQAMSPT
jgi:hypothetical protein